MEELKSVIVDKGDRERFWLIGTKMTEEEQKSLVRFLNQSSDVFSSTPYDMPRVDLEVISHKLGVDLKAKPVMQKQRKLAPERRMAVCEEVDKLLEADAIREVHYPEWLSNMVVVPKKDKKWRVCIGFTSLNKACLKDSFSLPKID